MYSPKCHQIFTTIHSKSFFHLFFIVTAPGPANYSARPLVGYKDHDFNSQKRRGPQWTFGINPKTSVEYKSPGPATSNIQNFTRFGRAFSQASTMYKRPKDLSKVDMRVHK